MPKTKKGGSKEPRVPTGGMEPNNVLMVEQTRDETGAQAMARKLLEPQMRHALTASTFANQLLGGNIEAPGQMDYVDHVMVATNKAAEGDLAMVSRMLAAQAITLDNMFTEFARRASSNMGQYLDATERYARLALKAQTNSRATLEALAKLHQPREQIVKHVHVNEGGQAVVADEFHNHAGGQNEKSEDQAHAQGSRGSALLGEDKEGNGVPVSRDKRKEAVPDARRKVARRSQG